MDYTRERSGAPGSGNGRSSSRKSTTGGSGSARRASTSPHSPPALFKTLTWVLILFCTSFASFYFGVWTGIQAASLEDESRAFGVTLNGQSGGFCTTACWKEISNENGEIQRKVQELAEKKVREGMKYVYFFLVYIFLVIEVNLAVVCLSKSFKTSLKTFAKGFQPMRLIVGTISKKQSYFPNRLPTLQLASFVWRTLIS